MKIKTRELADLLNYSVKSVQRSIKELKINAEVSKKTGGYILTQEQAERITNHLDNSKINIVNEYFDNTNKDETNEKKGNENKKIDVATDAATKEKHATEATNDATSATDLIKHQQEEIEFLRKQLEILTETNRNLTQINGALTAKLALTDNSEEKTIEEEQEQNENETPPQEKQKGFFSWLRRRKS